LHDFLDVPASSRVSFYLYNTPAEIDMLVNAIYTVKKVFHES
jgi:cysteine desulfurase/selenocysteine lyase